MRRIIGVLKYLIGWPLSAISLFFIAKLIISNSGSLKNLTNINLGLLFISFLCFIGYFFLRAYLWKNLIDNSGNKFSFLKSAFLWEISEVKRYTPGNIWAFLSRANVFSKDNITQKEVAKNLFNEFILISLSCLSLSYFYISSFNNLIYSSLIIFIIVFSLILFVFNNKINFNILVINSPEKNLNHYIIALISFLLFGLGTYFSGASIIYLNPNSLLTLVSLFIFALLVGYLSIITPMGLGVREGVTTYGLSGYTSASNAGLVSIFTRIIFILSEVLFLSLIFLIYKLKGKYFLKFYKLLETNKYELILFISILIFISYYIAAGILKYDNFLTGRFDLGNMDQAVWNTLQGRIFQVTDANGVTQISRLAFHADFILILIAPLYLIWSSAKMLIILQTVVVGMGVIYLYKISNLVNKNKLIALALSLSYLIYPAVGYTLMYDFHPVVLATSFLLATFYYFLKKKYLPFIIFAILTGLTKEETWSIISLFGIVIVFRSIWKIKKINFKEVILGVATFTFSAGIFYLLIWKIIPLTRGGDHFALSYFSEFGSSPSEVLITITTNPFKLFNTLFNNGSLGYLAQLYFPLGLTSLAGLPLIIFSLPDLLINTLSNNKQLHQIYYQYSATITPFVFISSAFGIKFLVSKFKFLTYKKLAFYIIATSLLAQYFIGPLPGSKYASLVMFTNPLQNSKEIETFLNTIPKENSIAASNNLGSHLSQRKYIYTIPIGIENADYVMFLLNDYYAQPSLQAQKDMVLKLKKSINYKLIYELNDFVAFKKLGS